MYMDHRLSALSEYYVPFSLLVLLQVSDFP